MILFEATFDNTDLWHHQCMKYNANGQNPQPTSVGNIFVPGEFDNLAFRHGAPVEHDPSNSVGWAQPEGHHESEAQYPERVYEGFASWMDFGFYRIIDTALCKTITVPQSGTLTISVYGHAWSSTNDNPDSSDGVGDVPYATKHSDLDPNDPDYDAKRNASFWVGVGDNPFDPDAISEKWHIYNAYHRIELTTRIDAGEITVFARGRSLWPFKHNNFYFDSFVVEFEEDPPPNPCRGLPREQYERTYVLLPPGANGDWITAMLPLWNTYRFTIGGSADDAGLGDLDYRRVVAPNPDEWGGDLGVFFAEFYPGVELHTVEDTTPTQFVDALTEILKGGDPNPTPPPNGGSHSRSPGLHLNTGDSGASDYYRCLLGDLPDDAPLPTVKAFGLADTMATLKLFKDIAGDRVLTVGRVEKHDGFSLESISLDGDLLENAQAYMDIAMRAWAPHRDYVDVWELINEQDPPTVDGHRRLAQAMLHCVDIAEQNRYTVAVLSYPLGVPEYDEMQAVADTGLLNRLREGEHYLALHEYDYPLDGHFGQAIPGTEPRPDRGAIAFRYRWWQDFVDEMPKILITEVNVAKDLRTLDPQDWDTQMRWYVEEATDIAGLHIFGWGSLGDAWANYDLLRANLDDEWHQMVLDYAIETAPDDHNMQIYSQRDSRWKDDVMLPSSYTIGGSGCAMTSATMVATQLDSGLTPKFVNQWLSSNGGYTSDGLLIWKKVADLVDGLEFVTYHTWRDGGNADMNVVKNVLEEGPAVLQVDFYPGGDLNSHFVVGLYMQDGDMRIIDPWTGKETWLLEAYGKDEDTLDNSIFALAHYRIVDIDPQPVVNTSIGFNDHTNNASEWMRAEGLGGLIVKPLFLGETFQPQNFTDASQAGQRVIVNLRYSYSVDMGGAGTIPVPHTDAWRRFVDASIQTINQSRGVWGWEIANEINNPREWPNADIIPQDLVTTYNAIRSGVTARMSPGALDPFHASRGDPRDWQSVIYDGIDGCEFVAAHGYIRGPEPSLIGSPQRFTDAPLLWQYLNYDRCVTALLEGLPSKYQNLPIYITEFNHLWKTTEGDWGWVNDQRAYDVILSAYHTAVGVGFSGLALYRWTGDDWRVSDNQHVLDAVREIA
jgi:hypothetical protein